MTNLISREVGGVALRERETAESEGQSVSSASEPQVLRVILVGRTGLDGRLRLDPDIELVRAANAYDALGELADPIDAESPERAVVVVSRDAEPGASAPGRDDASTRLGEFIEGLRLIQPSVRVLRAAKANQTPKEVEKMYDGLVEPDATARALADVLRPRPRTAATEPEAGKPPLPAPESSPMPSLQSDPNVAPLVDVMIGAPGAGAAGDERIIDVVSRGEEIRPVALELIRQRTGASDVEFAQDFLTGEGDPSAAASSALVAWRSLRYGWLRSQHASKEDLAPHATWLGAWLYMGELHTELRLAAFTDMLTGAWNRRYFDRFLDAAVKQGRERRRNVTVLVFDIDDFKSYNDRYGHGSGDEILREAVRLMKSVTRPTDRVCRIGGDEFAVIFHEPEGPRETDSAHPESVHSIARRFQKQILEHNFPKLGDEAPGTLTISGGLATFPWDGRSPTELVERADELAMQGKRAGKNAIMFGPEAMRLDLEADEHREVPPERADEGVGGLADLPS
ncbi:MAG: GGDEF domain-containing protein [Planctomycetota bacterium]